MIYGYARVSSTDQNLDRQIEAFNKFGVDKIYSDKMSGKNFERDNYIEMSKQLKQGDLLVVKAIDRLGRNYDMIIDEWRKITHEIKADIVVLDMPLLDTRDKEKGLTGKFISDIVLQILSYVAETERANSKQRQAEGIKIAKEKGVHMGRPKYQLPENFKEVAKEWFDKKISVLEALQKTNMSKSTFMKYAEKMGYSRYQDRVEYCLIGDLVDKHYYSQKELLEDLKISKPTLDKYFNGEKTIIQRMGLEIEKITKLKESNNDKHNN